MQTPTIVFPLSDTEILNSIAEVDKKINYFQMLQRAKFSKLNLFFYAEFPNKTTQFFSLQDVHFPFDLAGELKNLIEDSITEYEQQILALKEMLVNN
jgi:hypothetical protein